MSFETELLAGLGTQEDAFDIRVVVRRCYFYDFLNAPVRLWDGVGVLSTQDSVGDPLTLQDGRVIAANEWIGTISASGENRHTVPAVTDSRDGSSPRYRFSIPLMDEETFSVLKADQGRVRGREMRCYQTLIRTGEGLVPSVPLRFAFRLIMRGVQMSESTREAAPGQVVKHYTASVLCRSVEEGRTKFPGGTYTDTSQRERAALLGVPSDSGCVFVANNAVRTYVFP